MYYTSFNLVLTTSIVVVPCWLILHLHFSIITLAYLSLKSTFISDTYTKNFLKPNTYRVLRICVVGLFSQIRSLHSP